MLLIRRGIREYGIYEYRMIKCVWYMKYTKKNG